MFFPLMVALGGAVISLLRREKGRVGAIIVLILGAGLFFFMQSPSSLSGNGSKIKNLSAATITDWNWEKDPDFGSSGAIKWNVQVHNSSNRNIRSVRVEFTTYDISGRLVSTDYTYVQAVPSGGTRSEQGYADFYGTEDSAKIQVVDINYAE